MRSCPLSIGCLVSRCHWSRDRPKNTIAPLCKAHGQVCTITFTIAARRHAHIVEVDGRRQVADFPYLPELPGPGSPVAMPFHSAKNKAYTNHTTVWRLCFSALTGMGTGPVHMRNPEHHHQVARSATRENRNLYTSTLILLF